LKASLSKSGSYVRSWEVSGIADCKIELQNIVKIIGVFFWGK